MKNKIFFWDGLGKGVNALFMGVLGVFFNPRAEALGYGKW